MILSQSAEYAIRSVLFLARKADGRFLDVSEISAATDVPSSYLAKVLGQLVHAGVLQSIRGPSGGYRLRESARELTLESLVGVFDVVESRRCLLSPRRCGESPDCAVHQLWQPVAIRLREFLTTTTIADLSRSTSPSVGGVL